MRNAPIVESEHIKPGIVLDYDEAGNVVGIEVLSASKHDNAPLCSTPCWMVSSQ